nr:hypothetical protein [Pantoea vagans]
MKLKFAKSSLIIQNANSRYRFATSRIIDHDALPLMQHRSSR